MKAFKNATKNNQAAPPPLTSTPVCERHFEENLRKIHLYAHKHVYLSNLYIRVCVCVRVHLYAGTGVSVCVYI